MEDPGLSRPKKGSSAWKMGKIGADVAVAPFLEDLCRYGSKRGPAPGKRSELMWRWPPVWRISAAQGAKRGPAPGKR